MLQSKHSKGHIKSPLLIYVPLTLLILFLRIFTITTEGKDLVLQLLPMWFKDSVLVKVGDAFIKNQ